MTKCTDIFKYELSLIKTPEILEFACKVLHKLPDYFYKVPASSTGKYHPSYALGEGGLVRHTQAAVRIAHTLLGNNMYSKLGEEHDYILVALLLHDGLKSGVDKSDYTVHDHPLLVVNLIHEIATTPTECEIANKICPLIASHMGQWTTPFKNKKTGKWNTSTGKYIELPKPSTKVQSFVHQADYLASRKMLEFNFDAKE